jgi:hypothetical protein
VCVGDEYEHSFSISESRDLSEATSARKTSTAPGDVFGKSVVVGECEECHFLPLEKSKIYKDKRLKATFEMRYNILYYSLLTTLTQSRTLMTVTRESAMA